MFYDGRRASDQLVKSGGVNQEIWSDYRSPGINVSLVWELNDEVQVQVDAQLHRVGGALPKRAWQADNAKVACMK